MRARGVIRFGLLLCGWLLACPVLAHEPTRSFLKLTVESGELTARWALPLEDLQLSVGLDADDDAVYSEDELAAGHLAVVEYALGRLAVRLDGRPAAMRPADAEPRVEVYLGQLYYVLHLTGEAEEDPESLEVEYRVFFDDNNLHTGLIEVGHGETIQAASFNPGHTVQAFQLREPGAWRQFRSFGGEGVRHIWIGFDHILFLLALLLPAVMRREADRWMPADGFRPALWNVVKIVTAFTVAHSITLSLAALEWVSLPARWVESAIAVSVLAAALNNLRPVFAGRLWLVAFGFGLIHGFGFASVLTGLGLPQQTLTVALVGFNLGVEAGQLAIVALFFPIAYALRRTRFYQGPALLGGSVLILLLASVWLAERVFELEFLPL